MKTGIKNFLEKLLFKWFLRKQNRNETISFFIKTLKEKDFIDFREEVLIKRILNFRDKDARDIMIPRGDICAFESKMIVKDVIPLIAEKGFSRAPIYSEKLDNIIGILYVKDILFYQPLPLDLEVSKIVRPAVFIPESMKLDVIFEEFKIKKTHIAVVIDEYGVVSGLVTMEDLLEEIFGEIMDEYDDEVEPDVKVLSNRELLVAGKANIDVLYEYLGIDISPQGIDTINGLLTHLKDGIPGKGEVFEHRGLRFLVMDSDERQAKKVYITTMQKEDVKNSN